MSPWWNLLTCSALWRYLFPLKGSSRISLAQTENKDPPRCGLRLWIRACQGTGVATDTAQILQLCSSVSLWKREVLTAERWRSWFFPPLNTSQKGKNRNGAKRGNTQAYVSMCERPLFPQSLFFLLCLCCHRLTISITALTPANEDEGGICIISPTRWTSPTPSLLKSVSSGLAQFCM